MKDLQAETPFKSDIKRRKFLKCMAWTGTGIVWTVSAGGLLSACGDLTNTSVPATTDSFSFIQVSDTHIGFNADGVNTDVAGTLKQTVEKINALPQRPAFVVHTGDVSHNSKAEEFDLANQLMGTIKTEKVFYVPGEHDLIGDKGSGYRQRFVGGNSVKSWYSMDYKGVHFIALSNSGELDQFGTLGSEQTDWLKKDLQGIKKDTPVVVLAHVPLYSVYPEWGWETKDSGPVLSLLMSYSAVTILNGHIHQVLTKVDGNIKFYTANATAFPQHRPGVDKPNAYKLPASDLLQSIGYRTVTVVPSKLTTEINDQTLAGVPAAVATVGPVITSTTPAAAGNPMLQPAGTQVDAGAVTDFAENSPKPFTLPGTQKNLFVVKTAGKFLALSDICTHMGCEVNWSTANNRFLCPCHGSEYDITGKNVAGPAPMPLPRYKTDIINGRLIISTQT